MNLRLARMGELVQHVRREFGLSAVAARSLIWSQAHACRMEVRRGVRATARTTIRDMADFFFPLGLEPHFRIVPRTEAAKAACAAKLLTDSVEGPDDGRP